MQAGGSFSLSKEVQRELQQRFPKDVELSLGKHLPGKVPADLYAVLPVGKPAYLWYTSYESGNAAFVVYPVGSGFKFEIVYGCFTDSIAYGTILSGTFFVCSNPKAGTTRFFCADNIEYAKGVYVGDQTIQKKLAMVTQLFSRNEIANPEPVSGMSGRMSLPLITVAMPLIGKDINEMQGYLGKLPYPTYGLRLMNLRDRRPLGDWTLNGRYVKDEKHVFLVKANVEPDCYVLFGRQVDSRSVTKIGLALIPNYESSVMMNSIFRKVRENANIDLIEESEDEEDFEKVDPDRFLLPNVQTKMFCTYNTKFRKWVPLSVAPNSMECSPIPVIQDFHKRVERNAARNRPGSKHLCKPHNPAMTHGRFHINKPAKINRNKHHSYQNTKVNSGFKYSQS